jgi:hypothetical protein
MNYSMKAPDGVEFEVGSLYEALLKVTDKRKARGKRYSLASLLTLSVLAPLGGEDTPEGIADGVQLRGEQLRRAVGMKHQSMPHAVTYRRVLGTALDIQDLETVWGAFFQAGQGDDEPLAMDGKRLCGTLEEGQTRGVHVLAVYAGGAGVVLNEVTGCTTDNEISAAPKVLAGVALSGKGGTGEAMVTQRDLSAPIVERGGHYLWKVKDNPPPCVLI